MRAGDSRVEWVLLSREVVLKLTFRWGLWGSLFL